MTFVIRRRLARVLQQLLTRPQTTLKVSLSVNTTCLKIANWNIFGLPREGLVGSASEKAGQATEVVNKTV